MGDVVYVEFRMFCLVEDAGIGGLDGRFVAIVSV